MKIFVFENSQNLFSCGPALWSILVCKIPQLRTAHHISLESRRPEATKNSYYVLSTEGGQKKLSVHGLKYILFELKLPWPMSTISETYNCTHNILELEDVLPNVSFTASETERDYY